MAEEGVFPVGTESQESVFRSMTEAEVSLDEMLSLACRQGKQDIVELLLESGANVNHRNKAGNTPLLEACSQGHVSIARLLLDRSADIDAPTETTYDSALTWACTLGNVEIVRLLLDRKAKVEHRTKDGCTALMFAALAGHEKVAKLLLDHKAEINVESDSNKDSPLTFACWKGHQKVVELFLDRNADIEHRTKEGFSPLMFAALGGHTEVAELLLKHHAEVNNPSGSNNDIPLTSACWKGHHQVVALLLQHDSDIEHRTKDGCTPLMLAAREGHLSVAQLLLDHGAKVNMPSGSENNIPLTLACWKGHKDVVSLLLKNVSNIEHQNKAGCTPLMLAAREGHQEATRLLLDSGAQINVPSGSNDDTPLTLACWKGHEDVVLLLIERNSNVNHQTKTGCTPLMEATREGHVGVAKLLLEAGADVETPDNYGQSPFFMACWKGHADVAALLLEYDANKDCRTKTGITPLFQACRENHVEVVRLLLDYGCNPSSPFPNSRECPLTLAAEKGFTDLTRLLLSRSAAVETRTKKGCSPLYLACREGHKEIAIMLSKKGASTEAVDQRGTTPLLAAYKNGHFEVVEWLLKHVAHLPSDPECNKALLAPMPTDRDLAPQRTKCIELIMKAKNTREQKALANAKTLFKELDAEREKKESRRKAAAKKRDKRKKKKQKEQAEKRELVVKEEGVAVAAGEEEGEDKESDAHPLLTLENEALSEALDAPPADRQHQQKKRPVRSKKKQGSPEVAATLSGDEGSDSADEYHDALPEFSHSHRDKSPLTVSQTPPPLSRLSPPTATATISAFYQDGGKPSHAHLTTSSDMSTTRQRTRRSPQPKAEPSPPSSTQSQKSRAPQGGLTGGELVQNDAIRGDVDASSEHSGDCRKKTSKTRKTSEKDSSGSIPTRQKIPLKDLGWSKPTGPIGSVPVATRGGVSAGNSTSSSSASTTTSHVNSSEGGKTIIPLSQSVKGKTSTSSSNKQQSSSVGPRSHRSNSDSLRHHMPDSPPPPPFPMNNHPTLDHHLDSTPSSWSKSIYGSSKNPLSSNHSDRNSPSPYDNKGDFIWPPSSQNSMNWTDEADLESQLLWAQSTDDDKIRSQKLKAAAAAQQSAIAALRPSSTTASPTPACTTAGSSYSTITTTTPPTTQTWQEVTRTTRTSQMTVLNSLVGRIIGRGGSKINSIQVASGAHINVSRNIPKSTERLITIKGTQRSVSRAQELIEEALSTPDNTLEVIVSSPDALGKPTPTIPGSATVISNPPDSALAPRTTSSSRHAKRLPPSSTDTHPAPTISTTSTICSSEASGKFSIKRPIPSTKEVVKGPGKSSLLSTMSEPSVVGMSRSNTWATTSSSFASVAAAASSSVSSHGHASNLSPSTHSISSSLQDSRSQATSGKPGTQLSSPSPIPLTEEGDKGGGGKGLPSPAASPLVRLSSGGVPPGSSGSDVIDMNADFPPLSTSVLSNHQQKLSDPSPPASAATPSSPAPQNKEDKVSSSPMEEMEEVKEEPEPMLEATASQSPLSSVENAPSQDEDRYSDEESVSPDETSQAEAATENPVEISESPVMEDQEKGKDSAVEEEREKVEDPVVLAPPVAAAAVTDGADSSIATQSLLAVGLRPFKATALATSSTPTNQASHFPPTKVLPPASQSSSTLDLASTSRGDFGAIGPPPRKTSLPAPPSGSARKLSYAGRSAFVNTLENVREDPLTTTPGGGPHPASLSSASSTPSWPGDRVRSISLTGQHPHLPQTSSLPRGMPFKVPAIPPSQPPHGTVQSDDLMRPPGTPDTPHGENHPMNDQEFGPASGSVYGAIGSNMPSSTNNGTTIGSNALLSRSLSSPHTANLSYSNSPLSPHLPHQAPPPNVKIHSSSEIWVPHFGSGPRMSGPHLISQVAPTHHGPSYAIAPPSFPAQMSSIQQPQRNPIHHHHHHQQQHAPAYPRIVPPGGHKHLPDASHVISRLGVGDHQQHISDGSVGGVFVPPSMGMRHGGYSGEEYRIGNGNRAQAIHKRWSVPSYTHVPQPSVTSQFSSHQIQRGPGEQPRAVPPPGGIGGGVWSKPSHSSLPTMETRPLESGMNGQPSGFEPHLSNNIYGQGVGGGGLLSLNDPWGSRWSAPLGGAGFNSNTIGQPNGPIHPGNSRNDVDMKISVRSSETSWAPPPSGPGSSEEELEVNSLSEQDGVTELYQLMKSLNINNDHIQSLKARNLSLQQLQSMSEDEWKRLKLPVGPRVKLMNAISNLGRKPNEGQDVNVEETESSTHSSSTPPPISSSSENPVAAT